MKSSKQHFGFLPDQREVFLFTLENENGMIVKIINYGGTIISLEVPDSKGLTADVVMGLPAWDDWKENPYYFNCIIGRTCNRIGGAKFSIDGIEYKVSANHGEVSLHGGFEGFHKKLWDARLVENDDSLVLELTYLSKDGEEGFPGNLDVKAVYTLNNENELSLEFYATTDKVTPVNLTSHGYFNLAGEGSGEVYDTELEIFADQITTTDSNSIPTGEFTDVAGTAFDFTTPRRIGERIKQLYMGYDDNYVLRNKSGELALAARAFEPKTGRVLEIFTTEPGVQLYTSNWFDGSLMAKCGKSHTAHTAFCLETQHYPDSMNHPEFPDVLLRPGDKFYSKTVWKFTTR